MKLHVKGDTVTVEQDTTDPKQSHAHTMTRDQFAKHMRDPEFCPGIEPDTLARVMKGETFTVQWGEPVSIDVPFGDVQP